MKKSCFKGCFCSKAGFTLIELLVVVLIIGILVAVAVPQYQKAVDKARVAEVMPLVKNVKALQEVYFLHHGDYAANCEELGIDLPSGTFFNTSHWIEDNDGNFMVRCTSTKATGILLNSSHENAIAYAQYYDKIEEEAGKITCWARNESRYKQFCHSVCNGELEEQFNAQGKNNGFSCEL